VEADLKELPNTAEGLAECEGMLDDIRKRK
jgi:hypothetical protein